MLFVAGFVFVYYSTWALLAVSSGLSSSTFIFQPSGSREKTKHPIEGAYYPITDPDFMSFLSLSRSSLPILSYTSSSLLDDTSL